MSWRKCHAVWNLSLPSYVDVLFQQYSFVKFFTELAKMKLAVFVDFRQINSLELFLLYVDNIFDEMLDVEESCKVLVL